MARIHRRTVQKDLHDPDNHDGVITQLEPDILERKVKWALENITQTKLVNNNSNNNFDSTEEKRVTA